MKLVMHEYALEVIKEPGDPRFSGVVNAAGESRLLYHIKNQLNARGFDLTNRYGTVWNTEELSQDFEVKNYMAPFVVVKRKSDGQVGSLEFQHSPRFYYNFVEDK